MEAMRESWTDDRLDDFRGEVNRRFDETQGEVNRRFDETQGEMNRRFGEVNSRLDRLDDRFDGLQRTLVLTGGGIIATLIAGLVSLVLTQL